MAPPGTPAPTPTSACPPTRATPTPVPTAPLPLRHPCSYCTTAPLHSCNPPHTALLPSCHPAPRTPATPQPHTHATAYTHTSTTTHPSPHRNRHHLQPFSTGVAPTLYFPEQGSDLHKHSPVTVRTPHNDVTGVVRARVTPPRVRDATPIPSTLTSPQHLTTTPDPWPGVPGRPGKHPVGPISLQPGPTRAGGVTHPLTPHNAPVTDIPGSLTIPRPRPGTDTAYGTPMACRACGAWRAPDQRVGVVHPGLPGRPTPTPRAPTDRHRQAPALQGVCTPQGSHPPGAGLPGGGLPSDGCAPSSLTRAPGTRPEGEGCAHAASGPRGRGNAHRGCAHPAWGGGTVSAHPARRGCALTVPGGAHPSGGQGAHQGRVREGERGRVGEEGVR